MILENAVEDRYSLKKTSKQLRDSDGRLEVLRRRYMWGCQRFKTAWSVKLQDSVMLEIALGDHCGNCGLWTFLLASGRPNSVEHAKAIRLIAFLPSHSLLG